MSEQQVFELRHFARLTCWKSKAVFPIPQLVHFTLNVKRAPSLEMFAAMVHDHTLCSLSHTILAAMTSENFGNLA